MVTIIERKAAGGMVNLSVYIKAKKVKGITLDGRETDGVNTKLSLGMSMQVGEWQDVSLTLKQMYAARKRGKKPFCADENIAKLFKVTESLGMMTQRGIFDYSEATREIDIIMRPEEVDNLHRDMKMASRITFLGYIDKYINECVQGARTKRKSAKPLADGTIVLMKKAFEKIRQYQEETGRVLYFENIDYNFFEKFKEWMRNNKDSKGNPHPLAPNTQAIHISQIKRFLYAAEREHLTTNDDFKNPNTGVKEETSDNIYLTEEQIDTLYNLNLDNIELVRSLVSKVEDKKERAYLEQITYRHNMRATFKEIRDVFVVGCLTGQRYSDFSRINSTMIRQINGRSFIVLNQVKVEGATPRIPLDARVKAILDKYNGRLPKTTRDKIGGHMKKLGILLGWTHNAGIEERVGFEKVLTSKRFCDCICTHTCRRSWATNAYKRGVPLTSIMKITGHSNEATLRKYLRLTEDEEGWKASEDILAAGFMQLV